MFEFQNGTNFNRELRVQSLEKTPADRMLCTRIISVLIFIGNDVVLLGKKQLIPFVIAMSRGFPSVTDKEVANICDQLTIEAGRITDLLIGKHKSIECNFEQSWNELISRLEILQKRLGNGAEIVVIQERFGSLEINSPLRQQTIVVPHKSGKAGFLRKTKPPQ